MHNNVYILIIFLYTSSEHSENKINQTIPFKIASNRKTYFGLNLTKEVWDLYTVN